MVRGGKKRNWKKGLGEKKKKKKKKKKYCTSMMSETGPSSIRIPPMLVKRREVQERNLIRC